MERPLTWVITSPGKDRPPLQESPPLLPKPQEPYSRRKRPPRSLPEKCQYKIKYRASGHNGNSGPDRFISKGALLIRFLIFSQHGTGTAKRKGLDGIPGFPISTLNNLGPIPRENSTTPIPQTFAIRKWPSSWIRIMAPRISIDKMIFIWLNAFLS